MAPKLRKCDCTVTLRGEDEEEEEEEQANIDSKLLFGDLLVAGFITPAFLSEVFVKTKAVKSCGRHELRPFF